nr:hypothetical protein [Tanacetum cinerariifolium]
MWPYLPFVRRTYLQDEDSQHRINSTKTNSAVAFCLTLFLQVAFCPELRFVKHCVLLKPNGKALRKCILSGPYKPTTVLVQAVEATTIPEHTTVETLMNMSPENKAHFLAEKEAKFTRLLMLAKQLRKCGKLSKGKEIAKPITPSYETAFEEDNDPEQAQRDKDMQKNLALIEKYFKKIYKPTNNNLRTSSNSRNENVDTTPRFKNDNQYGQFGNQRIVNVAGARENVGSPVVQQSRIQCFNCREFGHFAKECRKPKRVKDSAYHKEKMLLCKQAKKGVPLQAEQYDWLADTDEEVNEQELEAHYSYMAKIQEVPTADTGTDSEPVESNTCLVETDDSNGIPDSPDTCEDDIQNDQNDVQSDDERVALANLIVNLKLDVDENKKIQKQLKKANTTLAQELKECKAILAKTSLVKQKTKVIMDLKLREEHDIDKMLSMEKQLKFLNEIVYKRSQSIQTIHMMAPKQEMHADLKYFESLEKEIDELESDKAEFSNMYDVILQECMSNDVKCSYLQSLSDLDALAELQCMYLHKVKECDSLAQKLSKQIESVSKKVHTKLLQRFAKVEKHSISLEIALQKCKEQTKSVPKANVSEGLSKPVTAQTLPQTAKKAVLPNNSQVKVKKTQVEVHPRIPSVSNKMKYVTACKDSLNSRTLNANAVCATCNKCLVDSNHFACVTKMLNDVHARTKPTVVPISSRKPKSQANKSIATPNKKKIALKSTNQKPHGYFRVLYENTSKAWKWWIERQRPTGYKWVPNMKKQWVPKPKMQWVPKAKNDYVQKKNMAGNLKLLCNFVEKFLCTVRFGNDQFAPILGYGDLVQGNVTINRVYYVEGLNHNLFSVGQFFDADLEVAFRKSTCFVRDLQGNNLLTAKRSSFKSKAVPSSKGRLNLLHMDLCSPMRIASINGKKYILVIVDDYLIYTWTLFLRSKDETPEVLKEFLMMIQRNLQALVITVRTDRGT